MRKLKRFCAAGFAALICAAAAVPAVSAADAKYEIPEIDQMEITLPEGVTAVTRDSLATDKYFSMFGIDYNTNKLNFESGNIYLQGMDSNASITITVTMTETEESQGISNYNLLQADKLSEVSANFLSRDEYTSCTPDEIGKVVWLHFGTSVNNGGSVVKGYLANTVYDGKSVSVAFQRNGGNVTAADYQTFAAVVASVSFNKLGSANSLTPYIIMGAGIITLIIIIFLIIIIKHAKRRKKKTQNDKIIEELADKYSSKSKRKESGTENMLSEVGFVMTDGETYAEDQSAAEPKIEEQPAYEEFEPEPVDNSGLAAEDETDAVADEDDSDYDEFLASFLGETPKAGDNSKDGDDGDFSQALPQEELQQDVQAAQPEEEDTEAPQEDALDKDDNISEFFDDADQGETENSSVEQDEEERTHVQTEPVEADIPDGELTAAEEDTIDVPSDEAQTEADFKEEAQSSETTDDAFEENDGEYEDFNNDEELVREESRQSRFHSSSDFFEEAPKKTMGILSGKDIEEAEEYDVINEVEQQATEVEQEAPKKANGSDTLKKMGEGFGYFFTHCGYFAKNLAGEIKHNRARKKRKKAEEERRRRARERAQRQRVQTQNGLVQVHRRDDRRASNLRRTRGSDSGKNRR